jgi:hypothetical protein
VALDAVLVTEDQRSPVGEEGAGLAGLVAFLQRRDEADAGGGLRLGDTDRRVAEAVGRDHHPATGRVGQHDAVLAVG